MVNSVEQSKTAVGIAPKSQTYTATATVADSIVIEAASFVFKHNNIKRTMVNAFAAQLNVDISEENLLFIFDAKGNIVYDSGNLVQWPLKESKTFDSF